MSGCCVAIATRPNEVPPSLVCPNQRDRETSTMRRPRTLGAVAPSERKIHAVNMF